VRIAGIKSVEEQGGGGGGPVPLAARAEASNAVPVEPGQLTVTASVRIVFDFQ
jgi:uncharacterized protein YggE